MKPGTVVATSTAYHTKRKIVLIVNKFGNLQAQPA
jgi:hypothetical protein